MRRRIHNHGSVFSKRLLRLFEDGFGEHTDVDAGVTGGWNHRTTRDGRHPDIGAEGGGGGEELGGWEVGEIIGIVTDVKEGGLGGEAGIFFLDLQVDFGFEVEVVDHGAFCLLELRLDVVRFIHHGGKVEESWNQNSWDRKMGDAATRGLCWNTRFVLEWYTYTFNVAGKSTPDEMFQARNFVRNLDYSQSLICLRLSRLLCVFSRKDVFPVIGYQEDCLNSLESKTSIRNTYPVIYIDPHWKERRVLSYLISLNKRLLIIEIRSHDFGAGGNESFCRVAGCIAGYGADFPGGLEEGLHDGAALHTRCSVNSDDWGHDLGIGLLLLYEYGV